jgi:hypothetical protein
MKFNDDDKVKEISNKCFTYNEIERGRLCIYKVTVRRVRATNFAVGKQ